MHVSSPVTVGQSRHSISGCAGYVAKRYHKPTAPAKIPKSRSRSLPRITRFGRRSLLFGGRAVVKQASRKLDRVASIGGSMDGIPTISGSCCLNRCLQLPKQVAALGENSLQRSFGVVQEPPHDLVVFSLLIRYRLIAVLIHYEDLRIRVRQQNRGALR